MEPKVAIVTGASSGIGLGIARSLLEADYRVIANARSMTASGVLAPSERLRLVDGDVGAPETGIALVKAAEAFGGRIDLLVNNAGIFIPKPFDEYTTEDFDTLIRTNLAGFFYVTQPVVRVMKAQGSGHIVNISTSLAEQPTIDVAATLPILTKGGLNAVTKGLAIELVKSGIRANAIGAGIIDTPMHSPDLHAFLTKLTPMARIGTVQEIVDAVHYLERATFVTGEVLHVDGGAHAGKW